MKSGELRILVTFDEKRYYPDVPTIIEKGVPELAKYVGGYRIVMGPPNMDREATRVLIEASRRMIQDPKYVAYVEKLEGAMSPLVGAEVGTMIEDRINWYAKMAPTFSKHMR